MSRAVQKSLKISIFLVKAPAGNIIYRVNPDGSLADGNIDSQKLKKFTEIFNKSHNVAKRLLIEQRYVGDFFTFQYI